MEYLVGLGVLGGFAYLIYRMKSKKKLAPWPTTIEPRPVDENDKISP